MGRQMLLRTKILLKKRPCVRVFVSASLAHSGVTHLEFLVLLVPATLRCKHPLHRPSFVTLLTLTKLQLLRHRLCLRVIVLSRQHVNLLRLFFRAKSDPAAKPKPRRQGTIIVVGFRVATHTGYAPPAWCGGDISGRHTIPLFLDSRGAPGRSLP